MMVKGPIAGAAAEHRGIRSLRRVQVGLRAAGKVEQSPQTDREQHVQGDYQHADPQYQKLDQVGNHHRDHAPQHGVEQHQTEQTGHDPFQVDVVRQAGNRGQEFGTGSQEQTHVEDPGQYHHHAAQHAHPLRVALLVVLGNRQHHAGPELEHDDTGQSHNQQRDPLDDRQVKGREMLGETLLRRVHDGHQTEFRAGHGGQRQTDPQRAAGDQVVGQVPDKPIGPDADQDRGAQVDRHDHPVQLCKIGVAQLHRLATVDRKTGCQVAGGPKMYGSAPSCPPGTNGV